MTQFYIDRVIKLALLDHIFQFIGGGFWPHRRGLKGFEKVKNIYVEPKPFDADRGLLTPTFKPKRKQLRIYYEKEIENMYAELADK